MLIELLIALILGILIGTFTGLVPGIHINLVGAILLSLLAFFLSITNPIILVIFIVSMSITHTFIDFIPSIFLGAPNEDTVLSVLPGHELLINGEGYEAVVLANIGSLSGVIIMLIISPIFIILLPKLEPIIKILVPYLLIASTIFLISKENKKSLALIVFLLSGFLGIAVLNSNVNEPLLPLLSGLFGASSLIISIKTKTIIPQQTMKEVKIDKKILFPPLIASIISTPLTSFLPGLGSGQAAVLGASIKELTKKQFLILLGAVNIIVLGLSFVVLYSINRKRTGMAVAVSEIITQLTLKEVFIILIAIVLTGIICYYWTLFLGRILSQKIHKYNYTYLSSIVLIIISIFVIVFSGPLGFFIYLISTATGIFGIMSGVKRINLMGCLVIPVILFYLV